MRDDAALFSDSFDGYLAKIQMRALRTVLVEGRFDKNLVTRLVRHLGIALGKDVVVDTVEMIREVNGITSNREKVEAVHRAVNKPERFAAFVDREFRKFSTSSGVFHDDLAKHYVAADSCFWTRGHSTENYFLSLEYLLRFLEFWVPELDTKSDLETLSRHIDEFVTAAICLSFVLFSQNLLSKASGILRASHWQKVDGQYKLDVAEVCKVLLQRGAAATVCDTIPTKFDNCAEVLRRENLSDDRKWCAHGHLGWNAVWTGLSQFLREKGIAEKTVSEVETGQQVAKYACVAELWISRFEERPDDSPLALLDWLRLKVAA